MSIKGLNHTEGQNRFRFENLSERLQLIDIDIIHRSKQNGSLNSNLPDTGITGCFFQDELENLKDLTLTSPFKRFYYKIWPLVQSLAELLFNLKKVIDMLKEQIINSSIEELPVYLQLLAVLVRDTQEEFFPYFHDFMNILSNDVHKFASSTVGDKRNQGPNPELIGKIFECMSHLIKTQLPNILKDIDCLRPYYGILIGSKNSEIRDFSSQMFTIFLRKLTNKQFRSHLKHVFRAIALSCTSKQITNNSDESTIISTLNLPIFPLESSSSTTTFISNTTTTNNNNFNDDIDDLNLSNRALDLLDGVSLMLFAAMKGIKNSLHSKGGDYLSEVFTLMLPLSNSCVDEILSLTNSTTNSNNTNNNNNNNNNNTKQQHYQVSVTNLSSSSQKEILRFTTLDIMNIYCTGKILSETIRKLFRHCHPENMIDLWKSLINHINLTTKVLRAYFQLSEPSLELTIIMEITLSYLIEIMIFVLTHSNKRALSNKELFSSIKQHIIDSIYSLLVTYLNQESTGLISTSTNNNHNQYIFSLRLTSKFRSLCCYFWSLYITDSTSHQDKVNYVNRIVGSKLFDKIQNSIDQVKTMNIISNGIKILYQDLFPSLSREIIGQFLLKPMLTGIISIREYQLTTTTTTSTSTTFLSSSWIKLFYDVLIFIHDNREKYNQDDIDYDNNNNNNDNQYYNQQQLNGSNILNFSLTEFNSLINNCFSLLQFQTNNKLTQSDILRTILGRKNDIIYACLCLSWMIQFQSREFLKNEQLKKLTNYITQLKTNIFPIIISQLPESRSFNVIFSYLLTTFCNCIKLLKTITNEKQIVKLVQETIQYLQNDILNKFVDILSINTNSLNLLYSFQRLLDVIICKFSEIISGDELQRNILVSLLDSKKQDILLLSLSNSLLSPSYWMRYLSIRILFYFPPPALIQNKTSSSKNDFELERDLDDEIDNTERVVYDVVRLCYESTCLPVGVDTEREFSRRMIQLEVYINSGKLPIEFSRIISSFCLGILFVKFQPLWKAVVSVLVSAVSTEESESVTWPLILKLLNYLSLKNDVENILSNEIIDNDPILCLEEIDSGETRVTKKFNESTIFFYNTLLTSKSSLKTSYRGDSSLIELDSRTNLYTAFNTVWDVFQKCPSITLRHSKVVVPMFLKFLRDQYYTQFSDDPELLTVKYSGLFNFQEVSENYTSSSSVTTITSTSTSTITSKVYPVLPIPVLKKRLTLFLQVFAAVTSPKQLYHHQALYKYYSVILSKPDPVVAKLALDCILTYKIEGVILYQTVLKNLFDDNLLRNELLTFDPSITASLNGGSNANGIELNHRSQVIPILIRILYGRFVSRPKGSKSAREQGLARRSAVLSFLAKIPGEELETFVHLMFRGLILKEKIETIINVNKPTNLNQQLNTSYTFDDSWLKSWYLIVLDLIQNHLSFEDFQTISWERKIGFLFLLEQCIKTLGFNMKDYVPIFNKVVVLMINSSLASNRINNNNNTNNNNNNNLNEIEDNEDDISDIDIEEDNESIDNFQPTSSIVQQMNQIRSLCLRRLSEMVDQYQSVVDFSTTMKDLWIGLENLLNVLPSSISGGASNNSRAPSLLKLLYSLVSHPTTIELIVSQSYIIKILIECVGAHRAGFASVQLVMNSLNTLLEYKNGVTLLQYSQLLIESFTRRFVGPDFNPISTEVKLSELKINPTGSVKNELRLLTAISTNIFQRNDCNIDSKAITNLSTLLLGMLRTYTVSKKVRVEEDWAINILTVYRSLLWRVNDVKPHIPFISRFFGPASHSKSLFNLNSVRSVLVLVYEELSKHPSTQNLLLKSYEGIKKLTTMDVKMIDGRDFSECMPVFQALSEETRITSEFSYTWDDIIGPNNCETSRDMSLCIVIIYECIRSMYDTELVIRTAALAALKTLITLIGKWSGLISSQYLDVSLSKLEQLKSIIIPSIHQGLKLGNDNIKKGFVQLLSHLIKTIGINCKLEQDKEIFHADLFFLINDSDPEQDFFECITHIQIHRRSRIFLKLRQLLSSNYISTRSFVFILLPLAFHPILSMEFTKKTHAILLQESSNLIGSIANYLPWTHYNSLITILLKHLDQDKLDKEKILITTLTSILDSFHFDLISSSSSSTTTTTSTTTFNNIEEDNFINEDNDNNDNNNDDNDNEGNEETKSDENNENEIINIKEKQEENERNLKTKNNIASTVIYSIFPRVKRFLIKHEKDHTGNKSETVRTQIAVALSKLLKRLEPPILTNERRNTMFTGLVLSIVNTLKSRDLAARDMARDSLGQMILTMGMQSLKLVLTELLHGLTEGYQRHVRIYTLRSLLIQILKDYSPPTKAFSIPLIQNSNNDDNNNNDNEFNITTNEIVCPDFDSCLSQIMEFCLDDLTGFAYQDRTVEDAIRTTIQEVKGNKANEILELCGRYILFRPSYALVNPLNSSIHLLVTPLLESLQPSKDDDGDLTNVDKDVISRITEALKRVSVGLAKNPTIKETELFLYIHSTLTPFVAKLVRELKSRKSALGNTNTDVNQEDFFKTNIPSYLKDYSDDDEDDENSALYSKKGKVDNTKKRKANVWLPTETNYKSNQREVIERRNKENHDLYVVQDGASAPKLTGKNKYKKTLSKKSQNDSIQDDPVFNLAIKFCLSLLLSCLKSHRINSNNEVVRSMALPFLPLLSQCLRISGNSDIVVLAMRCICALLKLGLQVESSFSREVGKLMLAMMYKGGAILSTDNDLVQTCMKGLLSLFEIYIKSNLQKNEVNGNTNESNDNKDNKDKKKKKKNNNGKNNNDDNENNEISHHQLPKRLLDKLPLDIDSIRSLISLLTSSILEITSVYQNSAYQLIGSIINAKIIVPEIYDLMNSLIEQIVLSHRKNSREIASDIVIKFLINYPLGKKRLEGHIKQFLQNCSYEFEEGRYTALNLLLELCRLLPEPVIDEYVLLIFLPMSMQVVNDISAKCRTRAGLVITTLMKRCSLDFAIQCQGYSLQWLGVQEKTNSESNENIDVSYKLLDMNQRSLIRTGVQVATLIAQAKPDLFKRGTIIIRLLTYIRSILQRFVVNQSNNNNENNENNYNENINSSLTSSKELEGEGDGGGIEIWALLYYFLNLLERLYIDLPVIIDKGLTIGLYLELKDNQELNSTPTLMLELIQEAILYPHAWVRSAACRILKLYFQQRDPVVPNFKSAILNSKYPSNLEILVCPNALYQISRRLSIALNHPVIPITFFPSLSACLVFIIRAMYYHPNLVVTNEDNNNEDGDEDKNKDGNENGDEDDDDDEDEDGNGNEEEKGNDNDEIATTPKKKVPSNWIMQRLRAIGADSRGDRRLNVIKVFMELLKIESLEFINDHLEPLIEVCLRARISKNTKFNDSESGKKLLEISTELLQQIENRVGSSIFIGTYGKIQRKIEYKKIDKKRKLNAEAVSNPKRFALRKIEKGRLKKETKKRKNLKKAKLRGLKRKGSSPAIIYDDMGGI